VLKIQKTQHFVSQFDGRPDPAKSVKEFCDEFQRWKGGTFSQIFGKDCAYTLPKVHGKENILMHVHLMPVKDKVRFVEWMKRVRSGAHRKTSNRALVYVEDGTHGILLISILEDTESPEIGAHSISRMLTEKDKRIMERFAEIAEAFIMDGKIIQ
jgi:hypothetical protein